MLIGFAEHILGAIDSRMKDTKVCSQSATLKWSKFSTYYEAP